MRRHVLWVVLFVVLVVSVLVAGRFSLLRLTPTQLCIASLPHAPVQMNLGTIRCTLGLAFKITNASGQWRVIQDHPPCDVSGIGLQSVEATPAEMTKLNCRPLVSFDVSASGIVSKVKLLRSSGSSTLDEKALRQVSSYRCPRQLWGVQDVDVSRSRFSRTSLDAGTCCSDCVRRPLNGEKSRLRSDSRLKWLGVKSLC
jgi:TonB family protein